MSKLTKRITAMLLAGMLVIGSVPGSVLAASTDVDPGQTSEIAQEVYEEESSEAPADVEETGEIEETSEAPVTAGEMAETAESSEEPTDAGKTSVESYPEEVTAEEEAQYYTVTLDANGGYFENEWDDAIGDYSQQAEVVEKHIPVDGTVTAFPVYKTESDGQTMVFVGWSLEPNGVLVSPAEEEYIPVDNCVLYAVWKTEDTFLGETAEQEYAEENNEQNNAAQGVQEVEDATGDTVASEEGAVEADTASEAITDPETESEQDIASDQEAVFSDEDVENTTENSSDAAVVEQETQHESIESSEQEETVREDGTMADAGSEIIASGDCGDNAVWTLDSNHVLRISGSGDMYDYNFYNDNKYYPSWNPYKDDIYSVIIGEGITSVGNEAFWTYDMITDISLPESLNTIGFLAFYRCDELTEVHIPDSVSVIGGNAFSGCMKLAFINIPSGIVTIGDCAFDNCEKLRVDLIFPDSITEIGAGAFGGCKNINHIEIPESLTEIKSGVFSGCGITEIDIPENITAIGSGAFSRTNLQQIIIPDSVDSLGERAFAECPELEKVICGNKIRQIPIRCFVNCEKLNSIVLPEDLQEIGEAAFAQCKTLNKIDLPDGTTTIGYCAFHLSGLERITVPESVTRIGANNKGEYLLYLGIPKKWEKVENYGEFSHVIFVDKRVEAVSTQKPQYTVGVGNTLRVETEITPADASCKTIRWSAEDPEIAIPRNWYTDDGYCTVVGKKEGRTTLYGYPVDGEYEITCTINVVKYGVNGISLSCADSMILGINREKKIRAEVTPGYATNKNIVWSSSDESVMIVNNEGIITGIGEGTATLTATSEDGRFQATSEVTTYIPVDSISLSQKEITLYKGKSVSVTAETTPENAEHSELTWRTSSSPVAGFSSSGGNEWKGNTCTIYAIHGGSARISVTTADNELTEYCTVNVISPLKSLALNANNVKLEKGTGKRLFVFYNPSDSTETDVVWSSSDDDVASVDNYGNVKANNPGTATITVTSVDTNKTATCIVSVFIPVENVVLDQENLTLAKGSEKRLQATVSPSNATDKSIEWKSSDENIATVDQDGVVTAVGQGQAIITATSVDGGFSSSCNVTVFIPVTGITLTRNEVVIVEGKTESLSATIQPLDATDKNIEWSSSDNEIVSVDQDGLITAITPGKAVITATSSEGGHQASCEVEVLTAIKGISLNQNELSLPEGKSTKIIAYVEPEDAYDKTVIWESSDDSIVTVDQNGTITAKKAGTAEISAYTADRVFVDKCNVSVVVPVQEIRLDNHEVTIQRGEEKTLHVKIIPENASDKNVKWESTDESIVEVDSDGTIKAKNIGKATVHSISNDGGLIDSCIISVVCSIDDAFVSDIDDQQYTGNPITPKPTVTFDDFGNSNNLIENIDYEIVYTDNIEAGKASLKISGKGNYIGDIIRTFDIQPADISNANVTDIFERTYTGDYIFQSPLVNLNSTELVPDKDYSITYEKNMDAGEALLIITGQGNYTGIKTVTFKINPATISDSAVSGLAAKTYTGKALTQSPVVKIGSTILEADTDYTVSYNNNTNVGTATVTITGKGNYTGAKTATFKINKAAQSVTASNLSLTYPNSGTISASGNKGSLSYKSSNTAIATIDSTGKVTAKGAGKATITITAAATNNYNAATKTITVNVAKAAQSITAKAAAPSVAVGKRTTVSITGNKGSKSFKSSDTTVATVSSTGVVTAKKVGTVKITATSAATSNYNAASKTVTIKVVPAATSPLTAANQATGIKLTWKKVTGANGYKVYRGSTLIKTITSGSTVTFADTAANTNGTKYTYKVVAKAATGDSTLSKSVAVYRVARPAISSVTNSAASKMTVKWGKNAKANGYQIQYSLSSSFASGNKAVAITSSSTVSRVIGSLTKGKTYYVRIRTYKTVGSTKYWSEWSTKKSVKISK